MMDDRYQWTARLLLVVCAMLCSCTGLAVKAPQTYRLEAVLPAVPDHTASIPAEVLVDTPAASLGLDTPRIAFVKPDGSLLQFDGVAWTDTAPLLVETTLVEALQRETVLRGVTGHDSGIRPDYTIQSELRRFEALGAADGTPQSVHVALFVNLVRSEDRRIVASRLFDVSQPVDTPAFASVVTAFDTTSGDAATQFAGWVSEAVRIDLKTTLQHKPRG